MDRDTLYNALRSRDPRFDGVFFVGISSTGIYCRPVCPARLPKREHCTFYETAAAAERDGYRPCLRCRPELSPGRARIDAPDRLAARAYARIAEGGLNGRSVRDLARELCVGERHLRRVVVRTFGVSPVELAQTQRLLFAKQLLTDTDLPVSRVAYASGFSSLSRFNALFRARYRMSPTELRRARNDGEPVVGAIRLRLAYRPPLAWDRLLAYLAGRATPGVELVDGGTYARAVCLDGHAGWFSVRHAPVDAPQLEVTVSDALAPVLMPLIARIRRLLDLDAEPAAIDAHLSRDPRLAPLVERTPGLRVPGSIDGFELAVRAVLGQQVSVRGATTLAGRLAAAYGDPAADGFPPGLTRLPVRPERLAEVDPGELREIGLPLARARTLVLLAQAVLAGEVRLAPSSDPAEAEASLQRIPGIGPWTAQYVAMRALRWPDALPAADLGLRRALGTKEVEVAAEPWRPWRAYATMHLWNSL